MEWGQSVRRVELRMREVRRVNGDGGVLGGWNGDGGLGG